MKLTTLGVCAGAAALSAAVLVPPAQAAAPARIVDRAMVDCSRSSMLHVTLERDRNRFEVDFEIYSAPRERWTVTIAQGGRTLHTVVKTANREGELDAWRYVPARSGAIEVSARSASGETCRASVRG